MRHAREDYQRIQDPAEKIPADEPVFLLRAKDKVAPLAVREWARLNRNAGGDSEMSRLAIEHAERMEAWQHEHGYQLADMPKAGAE